MVHHNRGDDPAGNGRRRGAPPMTYQRPWTGADDVTVRLRRCREPLPHTKLLYQDAVSRTVEPLELEIAQHLPDLCSRHGRPAHSRKPIRVCFYDSKHHPRFPRITVKSWPTRQLSPMSTILIGDWPVCDRCERAGRCYRRIAAVLATVMAANLLVLAILIIAGWAGLVANFQTVVRPMVWAFFPGSIPLGMGVAVWLASRSTALVVFRPIYDERFAFVQAHPRFRAALQAIPDTRQPDECADHQTGPAG